MITWIKRLFKKQKYRDLLLPGDTQEYSWRATAAVKVQSLFVMCEDDAQGDLVVQSMTVSCYEHMVGPAPVEMFSMSAFGALSFSAVLEAGALFAVTIKNNGTIPAKYPKCFIYADNQHDGLRVPIILVRSL